LKSELLPVADESTTGRGVVAGATGVVGEPSKKGAETVTVVGSVGRDQDDGLTQVSPMSDTVLVNSIRLTVGTKITNMSTQAVDLATMLPSAPAQRQNPSTPSDPAAPVGLFSDLAAVLASTVVPSVMSISDWGFTALPALVCLLVMILSLGIGRAFSAFGSWTRRGGFAHAARSDVPAANINTFFATPLCLGYVSAFALQHSPFLMVSETNNGFLMVPNVYRKEEMR
jgi:hypothetical protein